MQIISGEGVFMLLSGKEIALSKGDQLHIVKSEAYSFEGDLELVYVATPKWTPEQTSHVH